MLVAIAGPNLRDQSKGQLHVHAAGCADLVRGARNEPAYRDAWTIDAENQMEVVEAVYDFVEADELPDCHSEFHFFPCCKLPMGPVA